MNQRKFLRFLNKTLNDSRDAVIRYLTAELKFLIKHLESRPKPTECEKAALARAAKAIDPEHLEKTFNLFQPSTLLRWYRKLVAKKWDYSNRRKPGRPRVNRELEELVVQLALENPHDGYGTLLGRLKILGFESNEQTIKNILKRNGIQPSPERSENATWKEFLKTHWETLSATDFFQWEVLTPFGLVTYYVLFFIRLKTREIQIAGITTNPNDPWMSQIARNLTDPESGFLKEGGLLIHDRDAIFSSHYCGHLNAGGIKTIKLPAHSPNLNAYAERFVRTVKEQCLSRLFITSEKQLRYVLNEFTSHYHFERAHQGIGNVIPLPCLKDNIGSRDGRIVKNSRLGSLLNFYHREGNLDTTTILNTKQAS
jgi:transposase InsO family protein